MRPISVVATCAPHYRHTRCIALRCSAAPRIWATWITESLAVSPHRTPGREGSVIAGPPVTETDLPLKLFSRGKVRDTYELGADRLLMVATDRISAFDHVLPNGIPDRGKVLTQLSIYWFSQTHSVQDRAQSETNRLRVRRARLPGGQRVEGIPGLAHFGQRGDAARSSRKRAACIPDLLAGDESRERPRREHHLRPAQERGRRRAREKASRREPGAVQVRIHACRAARADPRRHEVRVRPHRR